MKLNFFQLAVLIVFGFFLLFGFLVFVDILPFFKDTPEGVEGTVTLWGTVPKDKLRDPLRELNDKNDGIYSVRYVEQDAASFDAELVEALASGTGPDMILLPQELIMRHKDKVFPLPYDSLSVRDFKDMFIEEGELYLTPEGSLALPFSVDPLVMYWNRDLFSKAGVSEPPEEWEEFLSLIPELTKKDEAKNILESGVAFGEYRNVNHAKDILSLLIIQAGNPITEREEGRVSSVLDERRGFVVSPAESAMRFYTEFANPVKPTYSWNRALPSAREMFTADQIALYFGYASERALLERASPHLNFDVAPVPQVREAKREATFGRMTGVAVLKSSRNFTTAFHAVFEVTARDFLGMFADGSGLPPVRRDMLSRPPRDAFGKVLYESALISRAWLDPDPGATENVFRTMIESVVSGRSTIGEAVSRAHRELGQLLDSN